MPLPSRVDAALLYQTSPAPDFEAVAKSVNEIMAPSGITLTLTQHKPGQGARLEAPGLTLTLGRAGKRLAEKRLAKAAAADYARLQVLDTAGLLAAHGGFIAVLAEAKGFEAGSQDTFETLLALTQIACNQIAMEAPPLCLYWGQSDQLFSPTRYLAMADVLFPLPLFCHPRPFSSGRMAEGTQCMGFRLDHAEQVLGRPLLFRDAPARLPYLLDRAYAFIDHCRESGRILGDGASFGSSPGEVIAVAHKAPSAEYPQGCIELTLREIDGVFQLQPEGAANPEGLAEARLHGAPAGPAATASASADPFDDHFSHPDSTARERIDQPNTGGTQTLSGHGGGAAAALASPDGVAQLRAASRERIDREKRKSTAHVKQVQWIGFLFGAGLPGLQTGATSPGLQKVLPWMMIAVTALLHPIAAVALLAIHLFKPMPYYIYGSVTFLVVLGATMTGASPTLGYVDVIGIVLGSENGLFSMTGSSFELTNFVERDYYEGLRDTGSEGGTGLGKMLGLE